MIGNIPLRKQNQVSCWYSGTIDANTSAPDVQIAIAASAGASELDAQVSVTPKGAVDPNTADNMVSSTTSLADFKLNGGGLGCSAVPGESVPAAGAGFLGTLLGLLGLRRRRR